MKDKRVTKIPWNKSIWFFDIDDTLIDTAGTTLAASEGIRLVFKTKFGPKVAKKVQDNFNNIFNLMLRGHQARESHKTQEYEDLISKVESLQNRVKEKYGSFKKFSREVFIKIAADEAGLETTPDLVHQAAEAYWLELTKKTEVFPGVISLISEIQKHNRPIYLITSSDGRLKMDENGLFDYDPTFSEGFKRRRIELLRQKGIIFDAISIGDPEDKPHLDFFQKAIRIAQQDYGSKLNLSNAIIVGDSYAGDLEVPKEKLGFGLSVLFHKTRSTTEINDSHQISTGDLSKISDCLN